MGDLVAFPRKYDPELTYDQLGFELGVSRRKLNKWHAEGMPSSGTGYDNKKRFRLGEVRAWLRERERDASA